MTTNLKVGMLGLGKLGLPLALVAARNNTVYAWDPDEGARAVVTSKIGDGTEPLVEDLLTRRTVEIWNPEMMGQHCDAVFIVVPTPSKYDGSFDDSYVRAAMGSLEPGLDQRQHANKLVIVLVSTVSPGTCDRLANWLPDNAQLVYAPTFIALGTVVNDLTYPALQFVGVDVRDEFQRLILTSIPMWPGEVEWRWMNRIEAEIAKLAVNSYVTMKITFANEIGQLCHSRDVNADRVLGAIGQDKRIGLHSLTAGGGFGGPCFPRDNRALNREFRDDSLAAHIDRLNTQHAEFIVRQAARACPISKPQPTTFNVQGLAYKEGTPHEIESFGNLLVKLLQRRGFVESYNVTDAELVVLALPLHEMDYRNVFKLDTVVFDVWRTHQYLASEAIHYVPFGGTT